MKELQKNPSQETRYIPVTKWPEFHAWPPLGGLRHLIFNSKANGFNRCVVRSGRRILINETKFFEWLDGNEGGINAKL